MRRTLLALLCLSPVAVAAQELTLRPPSIGDALRTMDLMAGKQRPGLQQQFVLPERPGQNQVAWYGFNWEYIDVPAPGGGAGGIRLYYYRNELAQARRALPAIQSAYARLVDQFHYSPTKRIPYILYATQREFQTQNVFEVSEGVLGVTSPQDLKMTVPYFGDHARFVEVSTHEMVHQFTIQKLDQAEGGNESAAINLLPLWFIEGIAEYYSKGGIDTETDLTCATSCGTPIRTRATRSCRSPRTGSAGTSRPTSSGRRASRSSPTSTARRRSRASSRTPSS
jgi:hypothetical protein